MKKNLLTVLILALVIVNIALTAVMMISVTMTNKKTAALVDTIATVMNLELASSSTQEEEITVSLADTYVYELPGNLTIPLTVGENGKETYMVCNIALSINTKHADYKTYNAETLDSYKSLIMDAIRNVIASRTEAECRNDGEGLKRAILDALHELFGSDFIYSIAMSEVKFG